MSRSFFVFRRVRGCLSVGVSTSPERKLGFLFATTSPERKLGFLDGRLSQAYPKPVLAHRARRNTRVCLAMRTMCVCLLSPPMGRRCVATGGACTTRGTRGSGFICDEPRRGRWKRGNLLHPSGAGDSIQRTTGSAPPSGLRSTRGYIPPPRWGGSEDHTHESKWGGRLARHGNAYKKTGANTPRLVSLSQCLR